MNKKQLNEGLFYKFIDLVADSLKRGNLKRIKKRIDKDVGLTKALNDLEKSWKVFEKKLIDTYGEDVIKKPMSNDEWEKKLSDFKK